MQPAVVTWPGGVHAMCLPLAQLEGLQKSLDTGPEFLLHRLSRGEWRIGDLLEILRWGLIGGGMPHVEADALIQRISRQHPYASFKAPALEVLAHALYGPADDPVGEDLPVTAPTPDQQKTGDGNSVPSTSSEADAVSVPETSDA
ncbi:gene transfer agent family protein [Palleronia caenipelagi]|uniref:Gene transfer agent family protein n=1 Tax=Palleronia caenipelagi TaxID=2489174 RepID=A0A547Q6A8_9RHOB|nr:gene transfer agent family protein [Palleronia caenipelagi]TRD21912.1 gene transfer agent family protein [Palleronia caenipelagi]